MLAAPDKVLSGATGKLALSAAAVLPGAAAARAAAAPGAAFRRASASICLVSRKQKICQVALANGPLRPLAIGRVDQ